MDIKNGFRETDDDKTAFSIYGLSVLHPKNWNIIFSPKTPPVFDNGFVRIEKFIPKKGAEVSLSLNWQKTSSTENDFAEKYCDSFEKQYKKQMKKTPFKIIEKKIINFDGKKAVYIFLEYKPSLSLLKKEGKEAIKTMQLAFFDEKTSRAVVANLMGKEKLYKNEEYFKEILFSVKCT